MDKEYETREEEVQSYLDRMFDLDDDYDGHHGTDRDADEGIEGDK